MFVPPRNELEDEYMTLEKNGNGKKEKERNGSSCAKEAVNKKSWW